MAWTDWAGPIGQVVGAGVGAGAGRGAQNRQYHAQKKLQGLAIEGQKEISDYEQNLAYEMWSRTGPEAQAQQMRDAGLNVGLMYKQGGAGGRAVGASVGGIGTGQAQADDSVIQGMDIGGRVGITAAQTALMRAQAENIEADTKLKQGEQKEKLTSEIAEIAARTKNEEARKGLIALETRLKEIEANVQGMSQEEQINAIKSAAKEAEGRAQSAAAKGTVDDATITEQIKQVINNTTQQQISILEGKSNINKTKTETENKNVERVQTKEQIANTIAERINMKQGMVNEWRRLDQQDREIMIKQYLAELQKEGVEFQTGERAETARIVDMITKILNSAR